MATILTIDDNQNINNLIASLFDDHTVLTACLGEEGLILASDNKPEIVLVDLHMPGMNGLEVIRKLRLLPTGNDIKIIGFTGLPTELPRMTEAGADLALTKPVDLMKLLYTVNGLLEQERVIA